MLYIHGIYNIINLAHIYEHTHSFNKHMTCCSQFRTQNQNIDKSSTNSLGGKIVEAIIHIELFSAITTHIATVTISLYFKHTKTTCHDALQSTRHPTIGNHHIWTLARKHKSERVTTWNINYHNEFELWCTWLNKDCMSSITVSCRYLSIHLLK